MKNHLKPLFAYLYLFCLSSCMSQKVIDYDNKLSCINIIDRNGLSETISGKDRLSSYERVNFLAPQAYQKVSRVYCRKPNGDIYSNITTYHSNGQLKQYLEVVNNRAFGIYREWHENGQIKIDSCIIGGSGDVGPSHENTWLFDNECIAWDDEGRKEASVAYVKGVLEGCSYYYHKNGAIWKSIPFEKGLKHGIEETFLDDGTFLQKISYLNGKKDGVSERFWNENQLASREHFQEDKIVSGEYYERSGKKIAQIENGEGERALFAKTRIAELHEYHEGELDGIVKVFNEQGEVLNFFHVKKGKKHGEEIEYYPATSKRKKQKILINWYQGNIQGTTKTWYPNGNQESQREMSHNEKNGLSTAWYEDGSLMMIEQYEKNILKSGKYFKKGNEFPVSQVKEGNGVATIFDSDGNFLHSINYHYGKPEV